jgi:TRAP-type C4-dicarboxylate transport system permease small subunit
METFRKFLNRVIDVIMAILCVFLASSTILYAFNSIARYGFSKSFAWIEEYSVYIIVLVIFFAQFRLEYKSESLSISLLADRINRHRIPKRILFTFQQLVIIIIYSLLFRQGIAVILQNKQFGVQSPIFHFPMYVYFIVINIALALVIVFSICNLFAKRLDVPEENEVNQYD